jgi:hypothetical protein
MSPTARKLARLAGELASVTTRLKNLVPEIQRLDLDSRALVTAKQPPSAPAIPSDKSPEQLWEEL